MFEWIEALTITGDAARARAFVPHDLPQLADHFPGQPLVPGSLLLELLAQTGGPLAEAACPEARWALLGLVRSASFPAPTPLAAPGVRLALSAELTRLEPSSACVRARAQVAGEDRARAELVFTLQPAGPGWEPALAARAARLARWRAAWEGP
ncbi:MAG: hypothetical protein R3F62_13750 [Planctomycetota bacterium]